MWHIQVKQPRGLTETVFNGVIFFYLFFFLHQGQEVAADGRCRKLWTLDSGFS